MRTSRIQGKEPVAVGVFRDASYSIAKSVRSASETLMSVTDKILVWFKKNGRPLPWRENPPEPYHVWLSEVMLQQTRIEAVRLAYGKILDACPTVFDLAALSEESLLKLWQGLGYYSRARNLHAAAKAIASRGTFPESGDGWRALPGIGEYTAGAIASIVLGENRPAVDGNVLRVLSRLHAQNFDRKAADALFRKWMPGHPAGLFTQAWMELGEVLCLPHGAPHCAECPLREECRAFRLGRVLDFPAVSPRKARPISQLTLFRIVTPDDLVALRQRPSRGLLAKMWEFPHVDGLLTEEQCRVQLRNWGFETISLQALPSTRHLFTHREWEMANFVAQVRYPCGGFTWATSGELAGRYAIPSAFRGISP